VFSLPDSFLNLWHYAGSIHKTRQHYAVECFAYPRKPSCDAPLTIPDGGVQ